MTAANPSTPIFANAEAAARNWRAIAERCSSPEVAAHLAAHAAPLLAASADPDGALNCLERLVAAAPDPLALLAEFKQQPTALERLVLLCASSPFYGNVLVQLSGAWEFLRDRGAQPLVPEQLAAELAAGAEAAAGDDAALQRLFRQVRKRELLRIAYRDLVLGEPLERIVRSISDLADGVIGAALDAALRKNAKRFGRPRGPEGQPARLALLGMGKLGGRELNYSSDVDFIAIYDFDGETDGGRGHDNSEFFAAVVRDFIKLLAANTPDGVAYRVDFRLRPHGAQAALCQSLAATLGYYERAGRTWERQAMVKARVVAGSKRLGLSFLRALEDFVFRGQLTFVEINEIQNIKGRIEAAADAAGALETNVKTGRGGIRDVEFVLQFLQLLNGARAPEIRDPNTLAGLSKLAAAKFIHPEERLTLENGYRFLRKIEHRLQMLWDLQTHDLPTDARELRRVAIRMGYAAEDRPRERFLADLAHVTERNRAVLKRLMMDLFPRSDDERGAKADDPVANLLIDPTPTPEEVERVLAPFGFQDVRTAHRNLELLAREEIPFLSSVRCRHFLASIAGRMLKEVSATPDPDMALTNLEKVSASLGAKGVLWESVSLNESLLRLYVQLCAWSQFLSEILINNPGMIDELLDVLVIAQAPTREEMETDLDALLVGASDIDPILHGFRNTKMLAIGISDVLGKLTVRQAARELADLAEVIVRRIADWHFRELTLRFGVPMLAKTAGKNPWQAARYAVVGLGKFGGRELGYHSDLDLVVVYEADGETLPAPGAAGERIDNFQFFSELAQRIIRTAGKIGPLGRLYPIDLRLRPTGGSGSLVSPLWRFQEYYRTDAQAWEFQALTRARVVHGDPTFGWRVEQALQNIVAQFDWKLGFVDELAQMRKRLEASRSKTDVKRGPGGLVDVEFAVQLMQLRHGRQRRDLLTPNVWDALERLAESGLWSPNRIETLREGYNFLRKVESRIRIVQNLSRDDLPENPTELRKLALRVGAYTGEAAGDLLRADIAKTQTAVRKEFLAILDEERARP